MITKTQILDFSSPVASTPSKRTLNLLLISSLMRQIAAALSKLTKTPGPSTVSATSPSKPSRACPRFLRYCSIPNYLPKSHV